MSNEFMNRDKARSKCIEAYGLKDRLVELEENVYEAEWKGSDAISEQEYLNGFINAIDKIVLSEPEKWGLSVMKKYKLTAEKTLLMFTVVEAKDEAEALEKAGQAVWDELKALDWDNIRIEETK